MKILCKPLSDWLKSTNDSVESVLIATDQCADTVLVSRINLVVPLAPFWREREQDYAPVLRGRATLDQPRCFQPVRDGRHVALISEQQTTEVNHGQAFAFVQVMQRPELPGTEAELSKELTISVI